MYGNCLIRSVTACMLCFSIGTSDISIIMPLPLQWHESFTVQMHNVQLNYNTK